MSERAESKTGSAGGNAAGVVLLALTSLSVISAVILLITGFLVPTPLAEYIVFAYAYGKGGKTVLCILFALLYFAAAALCAVMFRKEPRGKIWLKIPAVLLVFADLAVHAYVFLAAKGYQWNYLVCAVLDGVMIISILYGSAVKKPDGAGKDG